MFVGFDSSNYTTSLATLDDSMHQAKQVLSVKHGERGLRQSDAVFQHVSNYPKLLEQFEMNNIKAVGVSTRPRNAEGSYMPCFTVGYAVAKAVSQSTNVPLYSTSHQVGHILAALYSADKLNLINDKFIAFHLSGGTTEALLVTPDDGEIIKAEIIAASTDLKAGQAIDRTGVLLGLDFPCGKALDNLSYDSDTEFKIKPTLIGNNCSLSGVENKVKKMIADGCSGADAAKFVLTYVSQTVYSMLEKVVEKYGDLPVVFSGGVSSNTMLRNKILSKFNAYFAQPEFSLDNAAGVAVYAKLKSERV